MKTVTLTVNVFFKHFSFLLVLIISGFVFPAYAADITFNGSTNTDWGTATNWNGGVLPGSGDVAIISAGLTVVISAETTVTVQRIDMKAGAVLVNHGTLNILPTSITTAAMYFSGTNSFTSNGSLTISNLAQTASPNLVTVVGAGNRFDVNGTNNFGAKANFFGVNANAAIVFGGNGLTFGSSSSGITTSAFSSTGANTTITIESGVTINAYIAAGSLFYMSNNSQVTNQGTINATATSGVGGRALNMWQTTNAVTTTFNNEGTFNMTGFDAPTVMGGPVGTTTGYNTINNSGILNIQNNSSTSTFGLNLANSSLPNVVNNSGVMKIFSKSNAINLPASASGSSVINTGEITITGGNISCASAATPFPALNNNSGGKINFNYGTPLGSVVATNNVVINNNNGATIRGACNFAANTLVTAAGSTLSPGDYNSVNQTSGIGIMVLNPPSSGVKFPLNGTLNVQINGKTSPGENFDQLLCSELDISNATVAANVNYQPQKLDYVGVVYASVSKTGPFASLNVPAGWIQDNNATTTALKYYPTTAISSSVQLSNIVSSLNSESTVTVSGQGTILDIDDDMDVNTLRVVDGAGITLRSGITLAVDSMMLKSSASNGTVTLVDENGTVTATYTSVEQILSSGRQWWYLSSPLSAASSTVFSGDQIGKYVEDYVNDGNPSTNAPYYTSPFSTPETMTPGRGYVVKRALSTEQTYTFTGGSLNSGDVSATVTRTGTTAAKRGFNLVGNPYPSYIDWDLVYANASGLRNAIWLRTFNGSAMAFYTYGDGDGVPVDLASDRIAPMQAFWVKVDADNTTPTLTFKNTHRDHFTTGANPLRVKANDLRPRLRLVVSNGQVKDEMLIVGKSYASNLLDSYDIEKMSADNTSIPEIFSLVQNQEMVINSMQELNDGKLVNLGFRPGQAGNYTLEVTQLENIDAKVVLTDKLTSTQTELQAGTTYTFSSDATATNSRFSVEFRAPGATTSIQEVNASNTLVYVTNANQIAVQSASLTKEDSISVFNLAGQLLTAQNAEGQITILAQPFSAGVYLVKVNNHLQKVIVK